MYTLLAPQELKAAAISPAGQFTGYLAVIGNKDGNGDVIDRGAFTKTLNDAYQSKARAGSGYVFPMLWQHNNTEPIGGFTSAEEDSRGLHVRGQIDMDTPLGQRAYSAARKGYMRGLSIGYDVVKSIYGKDARHLTEVKVWEGSLVSFPANVDAVISEIKSRRVSVEQIGQNLRAAFVQYERERLEADMRRLSAVLTSEGARQHDREYKRIAERDWRWDLKMAMAETERLIALAARDAEREDD